MTLLDDAMFLCEETAVLASVGNDEANPDRYEGATLERLKEILVGVTDATVRLNHALHATAADSLSAKLNAVQHRIRTQFAPNGTAVITNASADYLQCFESFRRFGTPKRVCGYPADLRTMPLSACEVLPRVRFGFEQDELKVHVAAEWSEIEFQLEDSFPRKPTIPRKAVVQRQIIDALWDHMKWDDKRGEGKMSKATLFNLVWPTASTTEQQNSYSSRQSDLNARSGFGFVLSEEGNNVVITKV